MSQWYRYWQGTSDPGHRSNNYELRAQQLRIFFPPGQLKVLELGCGAGSQYEFLRENYSSYTGVDFSPTMLKEFHRVWPEAHLVLTDASTYIDRQQYDVIVSESLVQYLSVDMRRRMVVNAHEMLCPGGVCILGSVPDRRARFHYYMHLQQRGNNIPPVLRQGRRLLAMAARTILRKDTIGTWYTPVEMRELSRNAGYECTTGPSLLSEYRFHAVLTKQ